MITLARKHASDRWGRSLLLSACVFVIAALPLASRAVVTSFEDQLRARARTVPLLVGPAGSRFDLVLSGLHWRASDLRPIHLGIADEIRREPGVVAIPVHVRYQAQGAPIAAVPFEYFEFRGLRPRDGRLVAGLGEAVVGSTAARRLGVAPGDDLLSDQLRSYDITAPPAIQLRVVGVLAPTSTPDDRAVFVDLETAWLLEGLAHGHDDASEITDPRLLIGRSEDRVALSGAVVEHPRVDAKNAASFHLHGDRHELPVTAVIVVPSSEKAEAVVRTRVNANPARQAVSPSDVSEELIRSVIRVQRLIDAVSIVVGLAMLGLLLLIALLTLRARSGEIRTLREIGASRAQVVSLFLVEFGGLTALGVIAAVMTAWWVQGAAQRVLMVIT
ncbi:MAG: ABC transporter permease [Planctomycetota bacterium]